MPTLPLAILMIGMMSNVYAANISPEQKTLKMLTLPLTILMITMMSNVYAANISPEQSFASPKDDLAELRSVIPHLESIIERNQDKELQRLGYDDLTGLRKIMVRLDSILERNQYKELQMLKDAPVIADNGHSYTKIGKEHPLEASLMQHLLFLYQDMRQTLLELKGDLKETLKSSPSSVLERSNIVTPTVRAVDCSELLASGRTKSGVYEIYPFKGHNRCPWIRPVKVFCDMETNGGGWTVFLSREKMCNPVNFTRDWNDYKTGFGTPGEEHWLGNEHLHTLTSTQDYILRLEAKDEAGKEIWGEWNTFAVDSESNVYELTAKDAHPNNNDDESLSYHTGRKFSTFDRDNDLAEINCAAKRKGGWWYNGCYYINPTGVHDKKSNEGIQTQNWSKENTVVRYITHLQFKIRPKNCGSEEFP